MLKILSILRKSLKKSFDNIRNEQLKYNLLQAVPFWIGSVITGFFAVMYAKIFEWGENLLHFIMNWQNWTIFIIAPIGFVLSWWLVKEFAPNAKGSGIPQVMAAVELANPKEHRRIRSLLSLKIIIFKILSSLVLLSEAARSVVKVPPSRSPDRFSEKSMNIFPNGGRKFQRKI